MSAGFEASPTRGARHPGGRPLLGQRPVVRAAEPSSAHQRELVSARPRRDPAPTRAGSRGSPRGMPALARRATATRIGEGHGPPCRPSVTSLSPLPRPRAVASLS